MGQGSQYKINRKAYRTRTDQAKIQPRGIGGSSAMKAGALEDDISLQPNDGSEDRFGRRFGMSKPILGNRASSGVGGDVATATASDQGSGGHSIAWEKPDPAEEAGEFFENDFTQQAFAERGLEFKTQKELEDFINARGTMRPVSREELAERPENLTVTSEDFQEELKDPDYAESYEDMNARLQEGNLTLPAPIIFDFGDAMFGFAGNRRTNLAFENGQELEAFVVDAKDFVRTDEQNPMNPENKFGGAFDRLTPYQGNHAASGVGDDEGALNKQEGQEMSGDDASFDRAERGQAHGKSFPENINVALDKIFGRGKYRVGAQDNTSVEEEEQASQAATAIEQYETLARDMFERIVTDIVPEDSREAAREAFEKLWRDMSIELDADDTIVRDGAGAHYSRSENKIVLGSQIAKILLSPEDSLNASEAAAVQKTLVHETGHMIQSALGLRNGVLNELGTELLAQVMVPTQIGVLAGLGGRPAGGLSYQRLITNSVLELRNATLMSPKDALGVLWRAAWGDQEAIKLIPPGLYYKWQNTRDVLEHESISSDYTEEMPRVPNKLKQELDVGVDRWTGEHRDLEYTKEVVSTLLRNISQSEFFPEYDAERLAILEKDARLGDLSRQFEWRKGTMPDISGAGGYTWVRMLKDSLDNGFRTSDELQKETLAKRKYLDDVQGRVKAMSSKVSLFHGTVLMHIGQRLSEQLGRDAFYKTLRGAEKEAVEMIAASAGALLQARYDMDTLEIDSLSKEQFVKRYGKIDAGLSEQGFGKKMPTEQLRQTQAKLQEARDALIAAVKQKHGDAMAAKYRRALKDLDDPNKVLVALGLDQEISYLTRGAR